MIVMLLRDSTMDASQNTRSREWSTWSRRRRLMLADSSTGIATAKHDSNPVAEARSLIVSSAPEGSHEGSRCSAIAWSAMQSGAEDWCDTRGGSSYAAGESASIADDVRRGTGVRGAPAASVALEVERGLPARQQATSAARAFSKESPREEGAPPTSTRCAHCSEEVWKTSKPEAPSSTRARWSTASAGSRTTSEECDTTLMGSPEANSSTVPKRTRHRADPLRFKLGEKTLPFTASPSRPTAPGKMTSSSPSPP
mmetsp:Transcript_31183/g.75829  ORF Transcript_31183/g.75829 Transcript_31183/m.75829 type:complete len:255 (-) Transcript_31183:611-1375(-)